MNIQTNCKQIVNMQTNVNTHATVIKHIVNKQTINKHIYCKHKQCIQTFYVKKQSDCKQTHCK